MKLKLTYLCILFLFVDFINVRILQKWASVAWATILPCEFISKYSTSDPDPPMPMQYYIEINDCLIAGVNEFNPSDSIRLLPPVDNAADFWARVRLCGGFTAFAVLNDQTCPPALNNELVICTSHYQITYILHPETTNNFLYVKYLAIKEHPVYSGFLRAPLEIYINASQDTVHILYKIGPAPDDK